jgi:hypothetical protein
MSSQTEFILKGSTDVTIDIMLVQDNSGSNPGDPLTGLVYNSSGLVCYYREGATGSVTQLTLATQTVGGAHSDGGFVLLNDTTMPGMYRLDLSDTIVSGTNDKATVVLSGFVDLAPHYINLVLTDFDLQSANVTVGAMNSNVLTAAAINADAITAAKIADDAIGADQLAAGAVDEIWAKVVESEGSYTAQQALSIGLAVLAGETNTGGTVFRTPNDAATRVSSTLDASNNRTAMTLTPSS